MFHALMKHIAGYLDAGGSDGDRGLGSNHCHSYLFVMVIAKGDSEPRGSRKGRGKLRARLFLVDGASCIHTCSF